MGGAEKLFLISRPSKIAAATDAALPDQWMLYPTQIYLPLKLAWHSMQYEFTLDLSQTPH